MKITNTNQTRITIWQKQYVWPDFSPILMGALILILLVTLGKEITFLQPLRIFLGLTYVLFVPGYCLTTALFPRKNDLDTIERIGLSIGFSVAFVAILALVLDWLQLGLYPGPILLCELGMAGLLIAVTIRRRSRLPLDVVYTMRIAQSLSLNSSLNSKRRFYYLLIIGLVVSGLATWVFLTPISNQSATEFYILGSKGLVEDYPYQVGLSDEVQVNVGITNREKNELNYHFEVWVTDDLNTDRRERLMKSDSFLLRPGEKFEQTISWHMPWVGDDQKVELLLFDDNAAKPSRQLRMWINVQE